MILESILGVVTGFAGNVITGVQNIRAQKLKNEHELKMREYDLKEREQEAKLQIAIEDAHTAAQIEQAEAQAYIASMQEANKDLLTSDKINALSAINNKGFIASSVTFIMGLVDAFRAFIRPGLTAYLVGLTTLITIKAVTLLQAKEPLISAMDARELFTQVTDIVIYLTVSCVTWWFGDRRTAKFMYRLNDGNVIDKKGY